MVTRDDVVEALHQVEDPELGMDIVELGLMYDVEVDDGKVKVLYSLTSMGCPAGAMIADGILDAARSVPGVEEAEAELTFDPPWTPTACRTTPSSFSASVRQICRDFSSSERTPAGCGCTTRSDRDRPSGMSRPERLSM